MSYDSVETLKRFAARRDLTFLLLSDAGSKTIDAYGVRNKESAGSRVDGIPHPVTFIIDQKGIIRAKLAKGGYRDRHGSAELVEALKKIR